MFGLNKYAAKPPVLSDRAVCGGGGGGLHRKLWNERVYEGGGWFRVRKRDGGVER